MYTNFAEKILEERNKKLGLYNINTNHIFNTILNSYKNILLNAPREIVDYVICISFTNVNGLRNLGELKNLYSNWGDVFFIDNNNSSFTADEVNKDGKIDISEGIDFKNIKELEKIKSQCFSLKELINLCKENNFNIKIFSKDDDFDSMIEITVLKKFNPEEQSIKTYLNTMNEKKKETVVN